MRISLSCRYYLCTTLSLIRNPVCLMDKPEGVDITKEMKYSIGIDLGGTDIKAGLVSAAGDISCRLVLPTRVDAGPKGIAVRIAKAVRHVLAQAEQANVACTIPSSPDDTNIIGIGLGAPGLIMAETGIVHFSPNFPGWTDIPLVDYVNTALVSRDSELAPIEIPIFMDNDVNAMALGELYHGAGVGYRNIVALTLGTGVGGGVVIDGQVYHGSRNTAGELGHTVVEPNGRYCSCGNQGCLEAYAGAKNIVERTQQKMEMGLSTILAKDKSALTPQRIAAAAQAGDRAAMEIFAETGRYIGIALTSIAHILNPEIAIIGGGIAAAGEKLLFEPIRGEFIKRTMDIPAHMEIVPAALGNDAGIVGAAMLAFSS